MRILSTLLALGCAGLMAACGGGGDAGASVSNMSATPSTIGYGKMLVVNVSGSGLATSTASVEPGCTMTPTSRSDTAAAFTCRVLATGDLRVRVRNNEGKELASLRIDVAIPQVSMTVKQGAATGTMVIELDPAAAPKTAENFMIYVNTGQCFYRDTLFHRVIPNFVVQAGGYSNGFTPKTGLGPPIVLESNNGLKNLRGTIAMARTDEPNSATSQFYFNVKDNPDLDYKSAENPGYAVFGRILPDVQDGLKVIDAIAAVATQATPGFPNAPVENVTISACSQLR
ncbi:peptidylprolyl isomerase [Aquabacterium humicola]|uniref:peptidylprolyl isomerase n=1 Tax=Aquabacterium humicola TaxID=3237377 RepID=UPI002543C178|nr:peptidylprolyl isomerase [Rubrivivax pictus]